MPPATHQEGCEVLRGVLHLHHTIRGKWHMKIWVATSKGQACIGDPGGLMPIVVVAPRILRILTGGHN